MSGNGGSRVARAAQWGSILSPLVGVCACGLAALVAYLVNAEVRGWVWGMVDRVGMVVVVAAAGVLLGGVGWLGWRFGRELVRPIRWAGRLGGRFYRWVLWRVVVGPARRQFWVEASRGADPLARAYVDLVSGRLSDLDFDSLCVLEGALARRSPGAKESVLEYPDGFRLEPAGSGAAEDRARLEVALIGLQAMGAIEGCQVVGRQTVREFSVKVVLVTADWRALERLRVAAGVELARRPAMEELRALESAAGRSEELPGEEGEWSKEVDELGVVSAWVLDRVLYWYDRYGVRVVVLEDDELQILAAQLGTAIVGVSEACRRLREEGFLSSVDWKTRGQKCRVSVVVGRMVAGVAAVPALRKAIDRRMKRQGAWG